MKIKLNDFTEDTFLVGPAISTWQNSGGTNTNWAQFIRGESLFKLLRVADGKYIADGGRGSDFYNNFKTHIGLARELGSNTFRISIEWHHIEPVRGVYSAAAVQRYHEIFQCLLDNGMLPFVTLYHFVEPDWFTDIGGFEKEENVEIFAEWAQRMIGEYSRYSHMWVTFNEPTVKSTFGYIVGNHPPGHMLRYDLGGRVILNQLLAHIEVYRRVKLEPPAPHEVPTSEGVPKVEDGPADDAKAGPGEGKAARRRGKGGEKGKVSAATSPRKAAKQGKLPAVSVPQGPRNPAELQIGLVHNWFEYLPMGDGLLYTWSRLVAGTVERGWANGGIKEWLKTGLFRYEYPLGLGKIERQTWQGAPPMDFVGLNYYSRFLFHWTGLPWCRADQKMSDMFYPLDADGLYNAIQHLSEASKPIYITETGVADRKDRGLRAEMIETYAEAAKRAVRDGYNLRGFMFWTLVDNFEWDQGFRMRFGLYSWTQKNPVVTIKEGAKGIVQAFQEMKETYEESRRGQSTVSNGPGAVAVHEAVLGVAV